MPHQCTGCGHTFEDGSKAMLGGCPDCGGNKFQFYPEGTNVPGEASEAADTGAAGAGAADPEAAGAEAAESEAAEPPEPPETSGSAVASKVGRATTKVRDFVSADAADPDPDAPWPDSSDAADPIRKGGVEADSSAEDPSVSGGESGDSDIIDADARETERALEEAEDAAQADARSEIVSDLEVDAAGVGEKDAAGSEAAGADDPGTDSLSAGTDSLSDAGSTSGDSSAAGQQPPEDGRVVREPTGEEPDLSELRDQLNDQFESIKILEPGQYELNLMELYDRDEYIIALQENGRYVIQVPENFMGDQPDE